MPSSPSRYSVFTPFLRRFTDERAIDLSETISLYREVGRTWRASRWNDANRLEHVSNHIAEHVAAGVELPDSMALANALDRCQRSILALETTIFSFPNLDIENASLSLQEQVDLRRFLRSQQHFLANQDRVSDLLVTILYSLFCGFIEDLPKLPEGEAGSAFTVPLFTLLRNPRDVVEKVIGTLCTEELEKAGLFTTLRDRFYRNTCQATGVIPHEEHRKPLITPIHSDLPPAELIETYLKGTPFLDLFQCPLPFTIPEGVRFEHTHILAGTGHGKTQTLQHLILSDLSRTDPPSLIVIDSQGDMLHKLSRLSLFDPEEGKLASKLIIIDPADVEYPPALNMFDVNFDRIGRYRTAAREQILNGVIELYDYIFGSLLGAELTQKQSVIFRYIARLMLTIPGATIHTLIQLMTDATPFTGNIASLPPGARMFFETEFPHKSFTDTKRQIQRRLWGILENPTFERMLTAPKNRIDMFDALNSGKIVLVNTAKDFLKAERSSFLGRFFIALTLQAALERAALPEGKRRPAFLYIDEAADYFDDNIDDLLTQARKYNLGVVFSHQYLGQLAPALHSSIASNTSIKLAGGVSDRDARSISADMRTTPTFILEQHKHAHGTQFACYVRNHTSTALSLKIPFGTLEDHDTMSEDSFNQLVEDNRVRISTLPSDAHCEVGPDETAQSERPPPSISPAQAEGDDWSS